MTLAIVSNAAKQIAKINAQVGWLNIRLSISVSGRARSGVPQPSD
jgi:hypothetical protein